MGEDSEGTLVYEGPSMEDAVKALHPHLISRGVLPSNSPIGVESLEYQNVRRRRVIYEGSSAEEAAYAVAASLERAVPGSVYPSDSTDVYNNG